MRASHIFKRPVALAAAAGLCFLLLWAVIRDFKGAFADEDEEKPQARVQRVFSRNGEVVVTLSKSTQEKSGIATSPLESTSHSREVRAYGVVLQPAGLSELQKGSIQAQARVDSAAVKLKAAEQEYKRVKALNAINKNISDKALQAAETDWSLQNIDAQTSREDLRILKGNAQQQWGPTLARWVFDGSPNLQKLLQQQSVLIQLTVPPGIRIQPVPQDVLIRPPGEQPLSARFVSLSPRTDPRIQGQSFFYMASPPNGSILLPGMNITAYMPAGPPVRGVAIPASAVVWEQGKPWAYLQVSPEGFTRRTVSTETPLREGYFVTGDFRPGERIVVKGAQVLLSEELLPKAQEEDTD